MRKLTNLLAGNWQCFLVCENTDFQKPSRNYAHVFLRTFYIDLFASNNWQLSSNNGRRVCTKTWVKSVRNPNSHMFFKKWFELGGGGLRFDPRPPSSKFKSCLGCLSWDTRPLESDSDPLRQPGIPPEPTWHQTAQVNLCHDREVLRVEGDLSGGGNITPCTTLPPGGAKTFPYTQVTRNKKPLNSPLRYIFRRGGLSVFYFA